MSVRAVLGVGFALLLLALMATLVQSAPRQAGSNHVRELEETVKLRGDGRHCEKGQIVPKDSEKLRILVGTYGRPAPGLRASVRTGSGQLVTVGGRLPGGKEGRLDIPVRRVEKTASATRVCIGVSAPGRTVLYGSGGRVRLDWYRGGNESWVALVPTIAHRVSLARGNPFGSLLLAVAVLLVLGAGR